MGSIETASTPLERWSFAARRAGTYSLVMWPSVAIAFMAYVSLQKGVLRIDLEQAYLAAVFAASLGRVGDRVNLRELRLGSPLPAERTAGR